MTFKLNRIYFLASCLSILLIASCEKESLLLEEGLTENMTYNLGDGVQLDIFSEPFDFKSEAAITRSFECCFVSFNHVLSQRLTEKHKKAIFRGNMIDNGEKTHVMRLYKVKKNSKVLLTTRTKTVSPIWGCNKVGYGYSFNNYSESGKYRIEVDLYNGPYIPNLVGISNLCSQASLEVTIGNKG